MNVIQESLLSTATCIPDRIKAPGVQCYQNTPKLRQKRKESIVLQLKNMGNTSDQKKIKTSGSFTIYKVVWISNSSYTDHAPPIILKEQMAQSFRYFNSIW